MDKENPARANPTPERLVHPIKSASFAASDGQTNKERESVTLRDSGAEGENGKSDDFPHWGPRQSQGTSGFKVSEDAVPESS